MKLFVFICSLILLCSCQTAQEKAQVQLEKTLIHFKSLESRLDKTCLVEVNLSGPTKAKYEQSYPEMASSISVSKNYLWDISGPSCRFKATDDEPSSWEENHLKILKGGFCTLLLGFQIQNPLFGVNWLEREKSFNEGVWHWSEPAKGVSHLSLQMNPLKISVTSEKDTLFEGFYSQGKAFPKLDLIQRKSQSSGLKISAIKYQNFSLDSVKSVFPRELEKMDLFILDERLGEFQLYATAQILRCE